MCCPDCCSCGILGSSVVPFRLRVTLVLRDIIYVTIGPGHIYDEYLVLA
jgi:hypothetical protein